MKTRLLSILLIISIALSCRKDPSSINPKTVNNVNDSSKILSLEQVKEWYSKNVPVATNFNNLNATSLTKKSFNLSSLVFSWDKIQSVKNNKGNYWLAYVDGQPTFRKVKQGYRKIAFVRDSTGQIQPRILEIIPDGLYYQIKQKVNKADFTGHIFIYDQHYNLLEGKVFSAGKQIGRIKPKNTDPVTTNTSASNTTSTSPRFRSDVAIIVQDCLWHDDNYFDGEGVFTVYSELDCTTAIYDDGGSGGGSWGGGDLLGSTGEIGGGGGSASQAPAMSNLPLSNSPAINPKAYMDCFTSLPDIGSKESVTIYVQKPFPGTSFNVGPNSVGHVAIGLTKSYNGTTITQVVGFYPNATGLGKFNAPSKINDNGGDLYYDESITYNVIPQDFNQITNYISDPPTNYNVLSFNCTDFVYNACKAGNITLPDPNTQLMFGAATAMTPGALGSSIDALSGMAGVNTNGGTTPNSKGPCN